MYLKSTTVTRMFLTRSRKGKEFYRPRKKVVHTFRCDQCGIEFDRDKHQISPKRVNNDFKHFCADCQDYAMFTDLGRAKYRETLLSRIGRKWIDSLGYVQVYMGPDYSGTGVHGGAVREHILVMEEHLGRSMEKGEVVHHIDGDKANNNIENLQLMTVDEHNACHAANDSLVLAMFREGEVGYDKEKKRYYRAR